MLFEVLMGLFFSSKLDILELTKFLWFFLLIKTFTSNDFKYYLKIMEKCRIPSKYKLYNNSYFFHNIS